MYYWNYQSMRNEWVAPLSKAKTITGVRISPAQASLLLVADRERTRHDVNVGEYFRLWTRRRSTLRVLIYKNLISLDGLPHELILMRYNKAREFPMYELHGRDVCIPASSMKLIRLLHIMDS